MKLLNWPLHLLLCLTVIGMSTPLFSQGYWTSMDYDAPDPNGGVMVLLSDGTVMCKTSSGTDEYGDMWNILTPDYDGTYQGATWTTASSMHYTRLYFSSKVLKDGRMYVAGGEYGTGKSNAEVYDPKTDTWTMTAAPPMGTFFYDANSQMLPDGRVLQAVVYSVAHGYNGVYIYNPATNSYSSAPDCINSPDESSWIVLPDSSILFVDIGATTSERYIPSLNQWVADGNLPVNLYDAYASETGPAFLLPDGRVWHVGGVPTSAYYTPSGDNTPGVWAAGPNLPYHLASTDGAGSMMPNGKILLALAPEDIDTANTFLSPTRFFEFNYLTNAFTRIYVPGGDTSLNIPSFMTNMLNLPDGSILYATQGDTHYYLFHPDGNQLAAGKPTVSNITMVNCSTYTITGTRFNGISEGSYYGDDWQMSTNYPLIRLTQGANAWYARSYNWNRTGVAYGGLPDTATFEIPNLPLGTFDLQVIANGIHSDNFSFTPCNDMSIEEYIPIQELTVFPNPANEYCMVQFESDLHTAYTFCMTDFTGRIVKTSKAVANQGKNQLNVELDGISAGMYAVSIQTAYGSQTFKLIVQ